MSKTTFSYSYHYNIHVIGKNKKDAYNMMDFFETIGTTSATQLCFFDNGFVFEIFRDEDHKCEFEDYIFPNKYLITQCKKHNCIIEVVGHEILKEEKGHRLWEYYCIDKDFVKFNKSYLPHDAIPINEFCYELKGDARPIIDTY